MCPSGVLQGTCPGDKTNGRSKQREKPGDFNDALADFDKMRLSDVKDKSNGEKKMKVGKLPDGRTVTVRNQSTDQRPTLEIPNGKEKIKIRYGFK